MTAVMFEHRDQVYAVTLLPYDPLAVEAIKAVVPSFARRWSPLQREWLIDAVYEQRLAAALRRLDCTIVGLDGQRYHGANSAEWAREVFRRVGPERAPLAYKALSRICHPDTSTGDHRLMQELN